MIYFKEAKNAISVEDLLKKDFLIIFFVKHTLILNVL